MGTPAFALPTIQAIHEAGHAIVAVYSQPPRPAGRGQKEQRSPVHLYADAHGLPVYTPTSLKSPDVQAQFAAHKADVAVVAAYGLLLPKPILEACPRGCLNVHPSLLPRWRGAAPIQRTLMAGDRETGVAIMQMEAGLDTGPVLLSEGFSIPDAMDAGALHDALAARGAQLMLKALAGNYTPVPQSESGVTYANKITKADCAIDWRRSAEDIRSQIRGLSPAPGAFFMHQSEPIKIFSAQVENKSGAPGTVLDSRPTIACGDGALLLLEMQRPGKKRMSAAELMKGFALPRHTVLV